MKRLQRNTLYTQDNALEARVAQLERRIIPGLPEYAFLRLTTDQTASGLTLLAWDRFTTSSTRIFATTRSGVYPDDNDTTGDTQLKIKGDGLVVATLRVVFETGTFSRSCVITSSTSEPALGASDGTPSASSILDQPVWSFFSGTNYLFGTPEILEFYGSATSKLVTDANAMVLFWGADVLGTVVY